jgi:hypothetical protein
MCYRDVELLESLVADVEKNVQGCRVSMEGEHDEAQGAKTCAFAQILHV